MASIQTNYNLYLRDNVTQYLELKNKVAEFITDIVSRTGEYATEMLDNFNYCYKIIYESGETYDRRRNELSVEISKEDYKKIITGVLQERSIDQIE